MEIPSPIVLCLSRMKLFVHGADEGILCAKSMSKTAEAEEKGGVSKRLSALKFIEEIHSSNIDCINSKATLRKLFSINSSLCSAWM